MPSSFMLSSTAWRSWHAVLSAAVSALQPSTTAAVNFDGIEGKTMRELDDAPPPPGFRPPQLGRMKGVRLYLYAGYALRRLKKLLKERRESISHGLAVAMLVYSRRESMHPVLVDMLRQVYAAVAAEAKADRKRRALSELWTRLEAARRLERSGAKGASEVWMAIIREVEAADDPLQALGRYLGGEVPRVALTDDPYRQMWARLVADAGGDPQRFRQLFWSRKDGIRQAARNKAQREAVDAVAALADKRPDVAMEYARAIAEGRHVRLERPPEEVRKRAEEWLAALRHALKAAYLDAADRGVELHQAVADRGDLLLRFRAWHRRYGAALRRADPQLAERLAPAAELAELLAAYRRLWRLGSGLPANQATNAGELIVRDVFPIAEEISRLAVDFLLKEGVFIREGNAASL